MKNKTSFGPKTLEVGATVIKPTKNGLKLYWIFNEKRVWQPLARYLWEKAGRAIRPKHTICPIDGNPLNCVLENLQEVPCRIASRINAGGPTRLPIGRPVKDPAKAEEKARRSKEWAERRERIRLERERKAAEPKKPRMKKGAVKNMTEEERREYNRQYHAEYWKKVQCHRPRKKQLKKPKTPEQVAELQRLREEARIRQEQARAERKQRREEEKQRKAAQKAWGRQSRANEKREEARRFRTREVDMSQLIPVKINAKTTVYARPGQDIEEIKARYSKPKAA